MTDDEPNRDTERLIPIREETGLPPPPASGTRPVLPAPVDNEAREAE